MPISLLDDLPYLLPESSHERLESFDFTLGLLVDLRHPIHLSLPPFFLIRLRRSSEQHNDEQEEKRYEWDRRYRLYGRTELLPPLTAFLRSHNISERARVLPFGTRIPAMTGKDPARMGNKDEDDKPHIEEEHHDPDRFRKRDATEGKKDYEKNE